MFSLHILKYIFTLTLYFFQKANMMVFLIPGETNEEYVY